MNTPAKYLGQRHLMAKGLTCGKSRRRQEQSKFAYALEKGAISRAIILVASFLALASIVIIGRPQHIETSNLICRCFMGAIIFGIGVWYFWLEDDPILRSNSRLSLIFSSLMLQTAMVKFLFYSARMGEIDATIVPMVIPYIFAPLILGSLLGKKEAFFAVIFGTLFNSVLFPHFTIRLLMISLVSGFVAVATTLETRKRSRIIQAGLYAGLAALGLGLALGQIGPICINTPSETDWSLLLFQSLVLILANIFMAVVISGLLPIFENIFHLTTAISWLEMADLNHPLLRRLSLEAPGTYQHSMALAHLAEATAEAIGANPTICRVGAYFHDIGKLVKPEYFIENMSDHQKNPHDELTPTMSALIITAHIKEGVDLAIKNHLHQEVIDIIRQHHGTTMVGYFYQRACQHCDDARLGSRIINVRPEDIPTIEPQNFRYPGPKPQSREAAVIGLADALESASRSMPQITPQQIQDLTQKLLDDRLYDHQYDECPITIAELQKVVTTLTATLSKMHHIRISYERTS